MENFLLSDFVTMLQSVPSFLEWLAYLTRLGSTSRRVSYTSRATSRSDSSYIIITPSSTFRLSIQTHLEPHMLTAPPGRLTHHAMALRTRPDHATASEGREWKQLALWDVASRPSQPFATQSFCIRNIVNSR